jgi:hypothetical protein
MVSCGVLSPACYKLYVPRQCHQSLNKIDPSTDLPQKLSIQSFQKDLEIMSIQSWESRAAEKRASILAKIPAEWRLSPKKLEEAAQQRDTTGSFIQSFLTAEDVDIVTKDSVQIVDAIRHGRLTALRVTYSFCKTAAIAHQIVSENHDFGQNPQSTRRRAHIDIGARAIVFTKSSSTKPSKKQGNSMPTTQRNKVQLSGRYTVSPSVLRTSSTSRASIRRWDTLDTLEPT